MIIPYGWWYYHRIYVTARLKSIMKQKWVPGNFFKSRKAKRGRPASLTREDYVV